MSEPLRLGTNLRYPITISKLVAKPGDELKKGATAMEYSFKWTKEVGDPITGDVWEEEQTTISSWGSPVEGKLKEWRIRPGDVITRDRPAVVVEEACQHPVQIAGLCALCGKDMTEIDWSTERAETERAPINMTHDQVGLTVSRQQALKVELELQRRLLEQRKLSLVVDLDQTVIHACIDPTVGEWQKDPTNPNYEAVKDVQSFQLNDDGPRGVASGCSYYIKMRPGLREFLEHISTMYELHVYTMGTRAYATNIAKIIDPDLKLFGNRVISRDENGSMTAKSLQRLFPASTNMVVIIDDRADVWPKNRPNLIKVVPYDFFKGVGDINSSFLPKREDQLTPDKPEPNGKPPAAVSGKSDEAPKVSPLEGLAGMSSGDDAALLRLQQEEQERTLEKQLQDRPLLHMQEKLDKEEEAPEKTSDENQAPENSEGPSATPPQHRHQVLFDDDRELQYLDDHLTTLHSKYYELCSAQSPTSTSIPDVGAVLDELKSEVLRGTRIVLSGLVPLGVDVYRSEIGLQVLSFGADLRTRIEPDVTHLVISSSRPRTQKVRQAARLETIKIVNQDWLQDSISQWEELDETPYLVDVHPADRGGGGRLVIPAQQISTAGDIRPEEGEAEEDDSAEEEVENPIEDLRSPIEDLKGFDFDKVDEELAEFLADGTDDDSEADGDGDDETNSTDHESEHESTKSQSEYGDASGMPVNGTKRKHDADNDTPTSGSPSSSLSKKIRISRSRGGSNLRSAYVVEGTTDHRPAPGPPEATAEVNGNDKQENGQKEALGGDAIVEDEEEEVVLLEAGEDGFDDDLEADLLAELDREQAAEEVEDGPGVAEKG